MTPAMPVGHMGPDEVVTVSPEATVTDVVDRLGSENVGSIVVTEDDKPVGIVTDRDVALSVTAGDDLSSKRVTEIMSEDPVTLPEGAAGIEISRAIGDNNVRRVPVVDDDGTLSGIVTLDDLIATVGEEFDNVADTIEVQSPDYQP